jgi:hypothetical protein
LLGAGFWRASHACAGLKLKKVENFIIDALVSMPGRMGK